MDLPGEFSSIFHVPIWKIPIVEKFWQLGYPQWPFFFQLAVIIPISLLQQSPEHLNKMAERLKGYPLIQWFSIIMVPLCRCVLGSPCEFPPMQSDLGPGK
jgi:hypothetical protein